MEQFVSIFSNRNLEQEHVWLVNIDNVATVQDLKLLLKHIQVTFDEDLYMFQTNQSNGNVDLLEVYRASESSSLNVNTCGSWFSSNGSVSMLPKWIRRNDMEGVQLRAYAIESIPYVASMTPLHGFLDPGLHNFSGAIPDIVFALQELMNFTLILRKPNDRSWGAQLDDGSWTGQIRRLIDDQMDFGSPTINA